MLERYFLQKFQMNSLETGSENNREILLESTEVKTLIRALAMAKKGFRLARVTSPDLTEDLLSIIKEKVPQKTGQPLEFVTYNIPKIDRDYAQVDQTFLDEKLKFPFWKWLDEANAPQIVDSKTTKIFVIDGSQVELKDRIMLIDYFAFMNGPRSKVAGNKNGSTLIIVPADLKVEPKIDDYSDLMSCCSGRYDIDV